jgi:hypothetical protein
LLLHADQQPVACQNLGAMPTTCKVRTPAGPAMIMPWPHACST